jgi:hypothetical protein
VKWRFDPVNTSEGCAANGEIKLIVVEKLIPVLGQQASVNLLVLNV